MKKIFSILILFIMLSSSNADAKVIYQLSFPEAQAHYVDVTMEISDNKQDELILKLPVWAPGSYLIREFARHVEGFEASSGGKVLLSEKINKNSWSIKNPGKGKVTVKYKVYAFEMTVRTSFIDASHAYVNGSNIFMYVDGMENESSEIHITPLPEWKKISCSLPKIGGNAYKLKADNYDILADSPIEIGNQDIIEFTAQGIPHTVAMVGSGTYDREKIKADFTKIVDEATAVFGTNPCKNYTFIVQNVLSGGGGLEHLNSTTVLAQRFLYSNEATYNAFLSLVAHEYFHVWNVKRLRPAVLGPFDYSKENYTKMLWVAEGFTAFYDNWLVRRTGFFTPEKYLDLMANEVSAQVNLAGDKVQPVSESSMDAWIKYYRRDENSNNSQVSYYDKGSILASLINMMIIEYSNGKQNLDDLMKYMYQEFYEKRDKGYTDEEFKTTAEKFTGRNLDEFYRDFVDGVKPIPYEKYYAIVGLKLTNINATKNDISLGANTSSASGKTIITSVPRNGIAYQYGLNVNDEIIAIDGYRVDDLAKLLALKKVGDKASFLISRGGILKTIEVTFNKSQVVKYKIEKMDKMTEQQSAAYKAWIR